MKFKIGDLIKTNKFCPKDLQGIYLIVKKAGWSFDKENLMLYFVRNSKLKVCSFLLREDIIEKL